MRLLSALDPTGEKARAVKARYVGVCRGCGAYTQPRNGKGDAYAYCKACHPRHQQRCRVHDGSRCNCKPSYYGVAYDRVQRKPVRTRRHPTVDGAKNARSDLQATLDRGEAPAARGPRLTEARTHFVTAAREGRALNKHGRRYKTTAIDVFEGRLRHDIEPRLGRRRITDIRRGEVQAIIDELAPVASGSSVRGVVNSLRALYTWAEDRDLVNHNPAARVKLPAMNASPIERVASPASSPGCSPRWTRWTRSPTRSLATRWPVPTDPARPLARRRSQRRRGRARRRRERAQVRRRPPGCPGGSAPTRAAEARLPRGRAPGRERTPVPAPLPGPEVGAAEHERARQARSQALAGGEARADHPPGVPAHRRHLARRRWGLAADRLELGHTTPTRQEGAATITLARYTHTLPNDVERARDQLAAYLAESAANEAAG